MGAGERNQSTKTESQIKARKGSEERRRNIRLNIISIYTNFGERSAVRTDQQLRVKENVGVWGGSCDYA